ncbi:MAG TPA: hypothetical protein VN840_16460 [Streptosporangiaceae bacterium]|nr:hypothetical protein [Streptosporangiaceae bacterium]
MPEDHPRGQISGDPVRSRLKPTVAQLGIDLAAQDWHRSGTGDGSFEVAFVRGAAGPSAGSTGGVGLSAGPDRAAGLSAGPDRGAAGSSAVPASGAGSSAGPDRAAGPSATSQPAADSTASTRSDPSAGTAPDDVWVLLRVAGDPDGRVLVYDRVEWECFLDGASRGEFDDAE